LPSGVPRAEDESKSDDAADELHGDSERVFERDVSNADIASGRRVLLAEDNVVNQKVATKLLERMGWRVDVAVDGREAVQLWSRTSYDAILMDCHMPGMDGYDATRAIRARELTRRTTIVALTASAMTGDRERCLAAGMDDYITKPIRREDLERVLHALSRPSA